MVPAIALHREELEKIVAASHKYQFGGGNDCHLRGLRFLAIQNTRAFAEKASEGTGRYTVILIFWLEKL
jgi:hypothetical protein